MKTKDRRTCPSCKVISFLGRWNSVRSARLARLLRAGFESGESSSEDILKLTPEQATQRF